MAESQDSQRMDSLLKVDDNGWDIHLFENKIQLTSYLCAECGSVCRDASELGCDHDDDHILLHCNDCLRNLINKNQGKCPIDGHMNPVVVPSRSSRRQISKASVLCPYSAAYRASKLAQNDNGGQVINTLGGDEKEGHIPAFDGQINNNHAHAQCPWKGTLNDLIDKHLEECTKQHNPSFALNATINALQKENNTLKQQVVSLLTEKAAEIRELKEELVRNNVTLNLQQREIEQLKRDKNDSDEQNKELQQECIRLRNQWESLNDATQWQCIKHDDEEEAKNDANNPKKTQRWQCNQCTLENTGCDMQCKVCTAPKPIGNFADHDVAPQSQFKFEFHVPEEHNKVLIKSSEQYLDRDAIQYQGSMFNSYRWCKFGRMLSGDDNITVYFNTGTIGIGGNYGFGFASPECNQWNTMFPNHAFGIDGVMTVYVDVKNEFKDLNDPSLIATQAKSWKLFDPWDDENIVVVSVNMKQRIGWIWNRKDEARKIECKLPEKVVIIVMLAGSENKTLVATKCDPKSKHFACPS
eukprot:97071_1